MNGKPVNNGGIDFIPLDPTVKLPRFGGPVTNGTYSITEARGPYPGKYRVEILWMKPTGEKPFSTDPGEPIPSAQALPAKFNSASELTAEITSGENKIDFNLTP